ncbi:MAG TPA: hypothetical protein VEW72_05985, partial [Burkholderiales bacterium]|nr:hypothetical protein [Burkholderiales bacterium]
MFSLNHNGHLAPRLAGARLQSGLIRGVEIKRWLRSSVAPLALLALVASGATALAQGTPQAERKPDSLGPVIVSQPQRKPVNRAEPGTPRVRTPARVAGRPRAPAVAVSTVTNGQQAPQ